MGFQFKNAAISFDITDENGALIKQYTINTEKEDFIRKVMKEGKEVVAKLDAAEVTDFDESLKHVESFVDLVLGTGEFFFLYTKFDKNFLAMIQLTRALADEVKKSWENRLSAHV